jgi:hypothetical protein
MMGCELDTHGTILLVVTLVFIYVMGYLAGHEWKGSDDD